MTQTCNICCKPATAPWRAYDERGQAGTILGIKAPSITLTSAQLSGPLRGDNMTITPSHKIAIQTKYIGPTNSRGSRYKAFTESGRSIIVHAAYNLSVQENHRAAALALQAKMGWTDNLIEGGTTDGYVYVADPGSR